MHLRTARSRWASALVLAVLVCQSAGSAVRPIPFNAAPAPQVGIQNPQSRPLLLSLERAVASGRQQEIDRAVESIVGQPRLSSDTLMQAGMFLAQKELYSPAAEVFKRCAHDYPELFESHYNLALARYALKQFPEAFLAIERAPAGSAPQEVARHYLRGKIEGALQRNAEAAEDLEMAFRSNPQQENYALDLGLLYLQHQQYPKAAKVFDGGIRLNPQSVYLWFGLALALFLEGRTEQCLSAGEHLLALRPDFTPASLLLAFVLTINGKLAEAEKMAAQGLNSPHPHPFLYYLHASILLRLHSKHDAQILRELTTAERAMPSCSLCALAKGKLEEARSDFPAAITDMERATRQDPAFPDPWYHLATLYARSGRHQEAELARRRFSSLKAESESRETQAFRKVLLESLSESSDAF